MRLEDYLTAVRRSAAVIVILLVIGCIGGLSVSLLQPARYRSTVSVFIATQQASNLNDLAQGQIFTQQAVKNYANVITTPLVLQPALRAIKSTESATSLSRNVVVDNPIDTTVLDISVTESTPVLAARTANAIERSLAGVVTTLTPPTADSVAPVRIILLESAIAATAPVTPNVGLNLGVGALVGLAIAVLVMLFRHALHRQRQEALPRPVEDEADRQVGAAPAADASETKLASPPAEASA